MGSRSRVIALAPTMSHREHSVGSLNDSQLNTQSQTVIFPSHPQSGTPCRQPLVVVDHTPAGITALQWPTAVGRRSFSSCCPTRDSSRTSSHGQRVDGRGRGPAPPLVDVSDFGERSSITYSHSRGTSVGTPREALSPPPPMELFDAAAAKMTHAELVAEVEALRHENRVLKTAVLRAREAYAALQEGMRESLTSVERRQESITNTLMRRIDIVKTRKVHLANHLRQVEFLKSRQEEKLAATQRSIAQLTRRLKREESAVTWHMHHSLQQLQSQRQQLEKMLSEQTQSLQQLEELVEAAHKLDIPTEEPRRDDLMNPGDSTALHSEECSLHTSPRQLGRCPRSSSPVSASSTAPAEPAYYPKRMVHYLEAEITSVEALRTDACERAEGYAKRCKALEKRVEDEMRVREQQLRRVRETQQDLAEVSSAVRNLSMAQEMSLEMEVDRRLNLGRTDVMPTVTNSSFATTSLTAVRATERGTDPLGLVDALPTAPSVHYGIQMQPRPLAELISADAPTSTTAVNLSEVVLVPGTEKYALPPHLQPAGASSLVDSLMEPHTNHYTLAATVAEDRPSVPNTPGLRSLIMVHDTSRMTPARALGTPEGTPHVTHFEVDDGHLPSFSIAPP